jgi:phytoene synthase
MLAASYRACRDLTLRAGSSFPFAFWLLPRQKRQAMWALYAFYRHTDDLVDDEAPLDERRRRLSGWRLRLEEALAGQADGPLLPALADAVQRHAIPHACLFDAIDGAAMDLDGCRYETFDDLRLYCHRVASVVGVSCIHVWGFDGDDALAAADDCGVAFQMTNILRDLKEDAHRGRLYLPLEDLRQFGCRPEELIHPVMDNRLAALTRFEIERAEGFYALGGRLESRLSAEGRRVFRVMTAAYRGLLDEIKRRRGDVFTRPVKLSPWRKVQLLAGAMCGKNSSGCL